MPRARDELTAAEWALLALLIERPTHGFALARAMAPDGDVGRVWALRRPLVYRALDMLEGMALIRPVGTQPSRSGPRRTILEATPAGKRALAKWLREPVEHVRDVRSLLMLKLLFLNRAGADPGPLLETQRAHFVVHADRLATAADQSEGFDHTLLLWRLHSTAAVIRFAETMLDDPEATPLTA
jgi:DNA-binding PadR family transcriptional regulator